MKLRKLIFWLHLTAGVFAAIVVFIMSITGVALTYQKQMTEWADRSYWPAPPEPGATPLPLDTLLSKVKEAVPDAKPSNIILYSEPGSPAVVTVSQGKNAIVDRYTGEITGEGSAAIRSFFSTMTAWHRYVGAAGESRPIGKAITGASNLAFLFIVISGIYIWWPRSWTRQSLRSVTWFRTGVRGRARDFNWHNVFGFWTAIPLFFVVISATVISYPWATALVYRITNTEQPRNEARSNAASGADNIDPSGIDGLVARAEQQAPGWRTLNFRLPASSEKQITFNIDKGWGGQPQHRSTVVLERATGEVARAQRFADQNTGQRARSWMRFVHTGEFYGLTGQTIAGIASAAACMLVITGLSLSVRRFLAWVKRRRVTQPAEGALAAD